MQNKTYVTCNHCSLRYADKSKGICSKCDGFSKFVVVEDKDGKVKQPKGER